MRSDLVALVLTLVLGASGCQPEAPPESVGIDISLGERGLRVERVYPTPEAPLVRPSSPTLLRYELVAGGEVVVAGRIPDFRVLRTERASGGSGATSFDRRSFGTGALRIPNRDGELVIYEPDGDAMKEIGRTRFTAASGGDVKAGSRRQALVSDGDVLGAPVRIAGAGADLDPDDDTAIVVELLIVSEGYTAAEMSTFRQDAQRLADGLLATPDFGAYKQRISIQRQDVVSRESGLAPGGNARDTAFELVVDPDQPKRTRWHDEDGARRAERMRSDAGAEILVVLANADRGGSSSGGLILLNARAGTTADGAEDPVGLLAHELGHALIGLRDEYEGTGECQEGANVAARVDQLPWMDILSSGVALPTPTSAGRDVVGAFAGAGGCAGGFRSETTCLMRERDAAVPMCKVCRRALDQFFSQLGDDGGHIGIPGFNKDCPARFRGDGFICDVCFDYPGICLTCPGKDPDCDLCGDGAQELCSCDLDGFCDPSAGETCASCPNDCGICDAAPCDFDGTCDADEACGTCTDCGACGGDGGCGDGVCGADEDPTSCPNDCGCASLDYCGYDPQHPDTPTATQGACYCDEACEKEPGKPRSCCPDACSSCGVGC